MIITIIRRKLVRNGQTRFIFSCFKNKIKSPVHKIIKVQALKLKLCISEPSTKDDNIKDK